MYNEKKNTYSDYKKEQTKNTIALIMSEYDLPNAILFLETNSKNSKLLISFYERNAQPKKALKLAHKIYNKTKDIDVLATIASITYESAKNKNVILDEVVKYFSIVVKNSKQAHYKNYYGYLLIDHNIDIKKGLGLAKKALKENENNMAYKDSVAWGYYKLNKCSKAYSHMSIVIKKELKNIKSKQEGFDVLLKHWKKIKKCYALITL
jgi:hypothetical protein